MAAATTVLACVTACVLASCSESLPVEEPRCSKFDFEEKLLEKMVRMEHSGGVMMEEFRELTADVKDGLGAMKREFDEIKRQAQEERDRNTQMLREYLERPSYAFSAYWLSNHDANVGDTLIFQNVILNEGNVYNKYTGEYTVQVNGTYMFSTTLCFVGAGYANVRFLADDTAIGIFRVGDQDWHLCASSSTIAYLPKDSNVRLDVLYKSKSTIFYDDTNVMQCSFSGHLVK